jgi:hypothetical protein
LVTRENFYLPVTVQELSVDGRRLDVEFNQMMAPVALVSVLPEEQTRTVDSSIDAVSK